MILTGEDRIAGGRINSEVVVGWTVLTDSE